jgi:hypothetical protein
MEEGIWTQKILRLTAVYKEPDKFLEWQEGLQKLF